MRFFAALRMTKQRVQNGKCSLFVILNEVKDLAVLRMTYV